jgi:hypothetical protein
MTRRTIFAAFCTIVSLAICACSGNRNASPAGGLVPALQPAISLEQSQGGVVPAKHHKISGTYKGTVTASADGKKQSGTIKVVIMQKKKSVSGPVYITLAGDTKKYSFSGKITSSKKKETLFSFSVEDGSGHASVIGKVLKGTAKVLTTSGYTVTFTFNAKK